MSDFLATKVNGWATDTVNDPGYLHDRAKQLLEDVKTAGENAVSMLIDALLSDPEVTVRERAASELRSWDDPRIIDVFIRVLENKNEQPFVREMVAEATVGHGVRKAIPALLVSLKDPSPEVRFWSVYALGNSECLTIIPRLRYVARHDRGRIREYGSISRKARHAISTIKGTLWNRSARKQRRPI